MLASRRSTRQYRSRNTLWDDTPYDVPSGQAPKHAGVSLPANFVVSVETEYQPDPATSSEFAFRKFFATALRLLKAESMTKGLTEEQADLLTAEVFDPCYDAANAIWEQLRSLMSRPSHERHGTDVLTCDRQAPPTCQQVESRPVAELPNDIEADDVLDPLVYEWTEDSYTVSEAIRNYLAQADANT